MNPYLKKILLALGVLTLGLVLGFLYLIYINSGFNGMFVQNKLEQIPGVKVLEISSDDDGFSHFLINVKEKGDIRITSIKPSYFDSAPFIGLSQIENCKVSTYEYGYLSGDDVEPYGRGIGVDISSNGRLGMNYPNIPEAIAHYDEILSTIQKWPSSLGERVLDDKYMVSYKIPESKNPVKLYYFSECS